MLWTSNVFRPMWLCALIVFLTVTLGFATEGDQLQRLKVSEVINQTHDKTFNDLLITQGIANLVAQELFDTGRFVPVEDNEEISQKIQELVSLQDAASSVVQVDDQVELAAYDAVASVTIKSFKKSRVRSFLGPFSKAEVNIAVEVEVSVQEEGGLLQSAVGKGASKTKSVGVLFQVREGKIHFDQTSAGQATAQAVRQAVAKLEGEQL